MANSRGKSLISPLAIQLECDMTSPWNGMARGNQKLFNRIPAIKPGTNLALMLLVVASRNSAGHNRLEGWYHEPYLNDRCRHLGRPVRIVLGANRRSRPER